ncbi:SRPBCC family protein [Bauldia sp.]|uniref:SRPBCC family protein n=1 Tax=Bauldia sp. TaxID=2575872 RepID=UPI003BAC0DA8
MATTEANNATAVREGSEADRTLVVERVFKASPERVFSAWTDPKILVQWWGPEGLHTPEYTMDVREGGAWRTVMMNDKGESHTASGVYQEIAPPNRLVMTWAWEQPDGSRGHETVVELSFEPAEDGTRLTLTQRLFANVEARDNHRMGWTSSLSSLETFLSN